MHRTRHVRRLGPNALSRKESHVPSHLTPVAGRSSARSAVAVVCLAASLLAACTGAPTATPDGASTTQRPAPGGPGAPGGRLAELAAAASASSPSARALAPSGPDPVDAQADQVDLLIDSELATCMAAQGFSQLQEAFASRRAAPRAEAQRGIGRVHPLEMGPLTESDAERFGMLGTDMAFQAAPRPFVESTDPKYGAAQKRCTASLPAGGDIQQRLADWREYASLARDEILQQSDGAVRTIARERLDCLRGGAYPAVEPRNFVDGDMAAALKQVQVDVGRWDNPPPDPPALLADTTRVVPASPRILYHPTRTEIAFAKAYAACGRQQDFAKKLSNAVAPAAASFSTAHAAELSAFSATFTAATQALEKARGAQ